MAELSEGTMLGDRFEIAGVLGQGGMATVYLATDHLRGERIALKVLHAHLVNNRSMRARLRREVLAASRLRHPNALVAHELHEIDHRLVLSLPLHRGATLVDHVAKAGPLSAQALISLARELSGALAAAHRRGVIHRDITPTNVMIDGEGQGCLTDFGLARLDDLRSATATGVLGTCGYAAPEVYEGVRADPRSDVYSLGAVLYLAATGGPPFAASSPMGVLQRQLDEDHCPLAQARGDLPEGLRRVLEAMLARDPGARPQGAREVALLFERLAASDGRQSHEHDPLLEEALVSPVAAPQPGVVTQRHLRGQKLGVAVEPPSPFHGGPEPSPASERGSKTPRVSGPYFPPPFGGEGPGEGASGRSDPPLATPSSAGKGLEGTATQEGANPTASATPTAGSFRPPAAPISPWASGPITLPPGSFTVVLKETRREHRRRRRDRRRNHRQRRRWQKQRLRREHYTSTGFFDQLQVNVRAIFSVPGMMTPEEQLAHAMSQIAHLPADALAIPDTVFTRHFRLVESVDEDTASRLVAEGQRAGFVAYMVDRTPATDGLLPSLFNGEPRRLIPVLIFAAILLQVVEVALIPVLTLLVGLTLARRFQIGRASGQRLERLPLAYGQDLRPYLVEGNPMLLPPTASQERRAKMAYQRAELGHRTAGMAMPSVHHGAGVHGADASQIPRGQPVPIQHADPSSVAPTGPPWPMRAAATPPPPVQTPPVPSPAPGTMMPPQKAVPVPRATRERPDMAASDHMAASGNMAASDHMAASGRSAPGGHASSLGPTGTSMAPGSSEFDAPSAPAKGRQDAISDRVASVLRNANVQLDALEHALDDTEDGLPEVMGEDIRRTLKALRGQTEQLGAEAARIEHELHALDDPTASSAAARIEARLTRLRTLAQDHPSPDLEEVAQLEAGLKAHRETMVLIEGLETQSTVTVAHLLEIGAAASQARRQLHQKRTDSNQNAARLLEQLRTEVSAAAGALREVSGDLRRALGQSDASSRNSEGSVQVPPLTEMANTPTQGSGMSAKASSLPVERSEAITETSTSAAMASLPPSAPENTTSDIHPPGPALQSPLVSKPSGGHVSSREEDPGLKRARAAQVRGQGTRR